MQRLLILLLLIAPTAFGQSGKSSAASLPVSSSLLSGQDSAMQLFEQALTYIQRNPFKKNISWDSLIAQARGELSEATSVHDAHLIVNRCLQQIQGAHSFVMPARNASLYHNDTARLKRVPALQELMGTITASLENDNVGYIEVPRISTTDKSICTLIADSLQTLIGRLASQGATRWIVDLRRNNGGNCWPMIAGVGPLLGEGVCGYFVRKAKSTGFKYEGGQAKLGATVMCSVNRPVTLAEDQRQQIIVLTGAKTSSSGEIVALAFRGLPQARLMGEPTAGLTTGNTTYDLFDGSTLVLSICQEADRNGTIAEGRIVPHELVRPDPQHHTEDLVKAHALMWLQSM